MFSQHTFKTAKDHIDLILSHYRRLPGGTAGNKLLFDLLQAIKENSFENIDYPLFQEILAKNGKTPAESKAILDQILKWKRFDKAQTEPTRRMIKDLAAEAVISRANELFPTDPLGYMDYIRGANLKASETDWMVTENFKDFDIASIVAEENSELFCSSLGFLNESFDPQRLVPGGQLIVISGLAGTGKSLIGAAECLSHASGSSGRPGVPTVYFVLGDLQKRDIIVRLNVLLTGMSFADSFRDLPGSYARVAAAVGDRLEFCFAPAGKIRASDIVEFSRRNPRFKVFLVDYDSNLGAETGSGRGDSLYLSLGESYNRFTELTEAGKLVYVMSQPKSFGNQEETESFGMGSLGDSRRKYEVADVIITFGRLRDSSLPIGVIQIAKNRRGGQGRYYYIRIGARFKVIPKGVYDYLKSVPGDSPSPTEADIDRLVATYTQQLMVAKDSLGGPAPGPLPGKSPF